MPEFSIIVPIYKVEKYLKICIDSIMRQSFQDFEVILVDDGSPDTCGKICDSYGTSDARVKVIHKENGGLSSARNAGLDVATGTYVIFVDSDDFWDDDEALEHIHGNLMETNADVLVFPAKRYYENEDKYTNIITFDVDRNQVIDKNVNTAIGYMIENNIYRAAAWNKVVKKTIIDNYSMRFKIGYLSEDMDWCGNLLLYAQRFDFYEKPLYVYRQQRSGSITTGKAEKLIEDKFYMCEKGYKQALQFPDSSRGKLLAAYYAYEYAVLLGVSSGVKNKKLLNRIRGLQILLEYDISKKIKLVNKLKKIIGYSLTRKVLCIFVKTKK